MKLQTQAAAWPLAHTELAEPVVHRHQLAAVDTGKVRVDAGFTACRQVTPGLPQAEWTGQQQLAALEQEMPPAGRAQAVAALGVLARMQGNALRQGVELHAGRHMIEQLDGQRSLEAVMQGQTHFAPAPQRQVTRQLTPHLGSRQAPQPQGVHAGNHQQAQQQAPAQGVQLARVANGQRLQGAKTDGQGELDGEQSEQQTRGFHPGLTSAVPESVRSAVAAPDPPTGLRYPAPVPGARGGAAPPGRRP